MKRQKLDQKNKNLYLTISELAHILSKFISLQKTKKNKEYTIFFNYQLRGRRQCTFSFNELSFTEMCFTIMENFFAFFLQSHPLFFGHAIQLVKPQVFEFIQSGQRENAGNDDVRTSSNLQVGQRVWNGFERVQTLVVDHLGVDQKQFFQRLPNLN